MQDAYGLTEAPAVGMQRSVLNLDFQARPDDAHPWLDHARAHNFAIISPPFINHNPNRAQQAANRGQRRDLTVAALHGRGMFAIIYPPFINQNPGLSPASGLHSCPFPVELDI